MHLTKMFLIEIKDKLLKVNRGKNIDKICM